MKRVLNSGYIKLLNILGSEQDILYYLKESPVTSEEMRGLIENTDKLDYLEFKFEIKCPLLCLQTFQKSNLGILETFIALDTSEVYLPPIFYSEGPSLSFHPMIDKHCNELNTKYSNFYRNVINFYNNLLKQGVCPSQAALVLPQGLFTVANWTITAKDLIEFIESNYNSSTEMFGYCSVFVLYLEEYLLEITKWLKANKWKEFNL